jgi:hypothetical protein
VLWVPFAVGTACTATCRRLVVGQETPMDASITVEVFLGASDRFECKIAAMINRPSHRRDCGAGRRACAGYDALALHAYILLGLRRATRPSMHAPGGWPLSVRGANRYKNQNSGCAV